MTDCKETWARITWLSFPGCLPGRVACSQHTSS